MRSLRVLVLALALGVFDCGPITVPASTPPANMCSSNADCAGYCAAPCSSPVTCELTPSGRACLANALPSVYLIVSAPEGSDYSPGQGLPFVITPTNIACVKGKSCAESCQSAPPPGSPACLVLPESGVAQGAYVVDGPYGGLDARNPITIPAEATFVPIFSPPSCKGVTLTASSLNLPLPNFEALTTNVPLANLSFSGTGPGGSTPTGPGGGSPIAWTVYLPPLGSASQDFGFSGSLVPSPPYDQLAPPLVGSSFVYSQTTSHAPPRPSSVPFKVMVRNPEGWTVYLRQIDPPLGFSCSPNQPGQIISNKASIVNGAVTLYSLQNLTLDDQYETVLSPPAGSNLPTFAQNNQFGYITQVYPSLPGEISVSGSVLSPSGTAVTAMLHFVGDVLYFTDTGGCKARGESAYLSYDVFVPTSDEREGQFSVSLPKGEYSVTIDPDPSSGVAKTTLHGLELPALAACSSTEIEDVVLKASDLVTVEGTVRIADGRPLSGAEVGVTPAAQNGLTVSPASHASADWARPAMTVTRADGSFTVQVDPNAIYDLTVRPTSGSNLPWIVLPGGVSVVTSPKTVPTLYVPAPAPLALTIHDNTDFPLAQAVIRAYAFAACPIPGETNCTGPALQIGEALTDAYGRFEMDLTPLPFEVTTP
jgi:hypothetical protein